MLKLKRRSYIQNKLINSLKIKKILKLIILKSIIQNNTLLAKNKTRWLLLYKFYNYRTTKKSNICLHSGKFNSLNKYTNFNRHEFHQLCRSNKLGGWVVNSW